MADVLSFSEVESLLSVLDSTSHFAASAAQPVDDGLRQLERLSHEQLRSIHALHAGFSREFGARLSSVMRSTCDVQLIRVEPLTYSDFVVGLEAPTCFVLLESKGLGRHLILDLSSSIVFPIVDRLLGGGQATMSQACPQRPLTEIELKIASRVTDLAINALENAWANVCDLQLRVSQMESNPQRVQVVPPDEVVVLIQFEITLGARRGLMTLCVPFDAISSQAHQPTQETVQKIGLDAGRSRETAEFIVRMASTKLSAADVMNLEVGDVIMTDAKVSDGVEILIDGLPAFRGFPGTFKNKKAVRVAPKTH